MSNCQPCYEMVQQSKGRPYEWCESCKTARDTYLRNTYRFDDIQAAGVELVSLSRAVFESDEKPLLTKAGKARKGHEYDLEAVRRRQYGQRAITVLRNRAVRRETTEADPWIHIRPTTQDSAWLRTPVSVELEEVERNSTDGYLSEAGLAYLRALRKWVEHFRSTGY